MLIYKNIKYFFKKIPYKAFFAAIPIADPVKIAIFIKPNPIKDNATEVEKIEFSKKLSTVSK